MYTFKKIAGTIIGVAALAGCIKNDLPYPQIQANFTDFMVEGENAPAVIDPETRTITLSLGEEVNPAQVEVLSYELEPEGARVADGGLPGSLDLTQPRSVTLALYQEYVWTIRATQTIERYIRLSPQLGSAVIDVPGRRVIAYVPTGTDLTRIKILALKLAGPQAVMTPDPTGQTVDLSEPMEVTVSEFGKKSAWTIYVEETDASVSLDRVDAWTRVAWIYANAEDGKDNGFEYCLRGSEEWVRVPEEYITRGAGTYSARLIHLSPSTTYEVRAYSDADMTAPAEFTTGEEAQLPNADFDLWWLSGKVWNPWAEGGTPYWDTGNKGSTTLGSANSVPTEDTPSGTGYAAELKTEFKGIGSLGKIAAGSIFTGVYAKTDGTNGILNFGRPFGERPTRMTGMMRYKTAPISHVGSDKQFADWKGRPDTASIYIALADWTAPFEVRTNPRNRQLFDPGSPSVIAYGTLNWGNDVGTWTPFSIDLNYVSTSRTPRYILVVCSSSKYGDYFVGGTGAVLDVDDLVLEYDY